MKLSLLRIGGLFLAALTVAVTAAVPGNARPLDNDSCKALAAERIELASKGGVEKAIVKGPDWTRENMPAETLDRVQRYLAVEEQLRFRCRGQKPPLLEPEPPPGQNAETAPASPETGPEPDEQGRRSAAAAAPQPSRTKLKPRPVATTTPAVAPQEPLTTQSIAPSIAPSSAAVDAGADEKATAEAPAADGNGEGDADAADTTDLPADRAEVPVPDRKPPRVVRRYRPAAKKTQTKDAGIVAEQKLQRQIFPSTR